MNQQYLFFVTKIRKLAGYTARPKSCVNILQNVGGRLSLKDDQLFRILLMSGFGFMFTQFYKNSIM